VSRPADSIRNPKIQSYAIIRNLLVLCLSKSRGQRPDHEFEKAKALRQGTSWMERSAPEINDTKARKIKRFPA